MARAFFAPSSPNFNFCKVCRMRSESGVVKQGAFHALSSLAGSIVANLHVVAACFLSALFVCLLGWAVLLGNVASERKDASADTIELARTLALSYSDQAARAVNSQRACPPPGKNTSNPRWLFLLQIFFMLQAIINDASSTFVP